MKRLETIILFLFFLFLPTQLGKHFFMDFSYISGVRVDLLAPTLYFTDLISFALIAFNFQAIKKFVCSAPRLHLFLLYVVVFNVMFAQHAELAVYYALKYAQIYFVGVTFATIHYPEKRSRVLWIAMTALIIGASVELFLSIMQIVNNGSLQGLFYLVGERYFTSSTPGIALTTWFDRSIIRPYGTFSHPNSMGGFYLLIAAFAFQIKNSRFLYMKSALVGLSAVLIFISFSKTAIIGLLGIAVYSIYKAKKDCLPCITANLLVFAVVSALFLSAKSDPLSIDKRFFLLTENLKVLFSSPVLGVGLGHYLHALKDSASPYSYFFVQPVHNIFILLILQIGIPIGGWIIYTTARFVLKNSLILIAIALLVTGMMDHYWLTLQQNMLCLGAIVGLSRASQADL